MKMPAPYWQMTYSSSRRRHSHRCWGCNKTVKEGESVLMARVGGKATRCMHEECAAKPYADGFTGRDFLEAWGMEHLSAIGYQEAASFMETAPISVAHRQARNQLDNA
jgi:hypothetical protein